MDEAKMSPLHWRIFLLISAGYFFDVLNFIVMGSLIPDMVNSGFASATQAGWAQSATLVGLCIGSVGQGQFTDRIGRKAVYQFNLLLFGLATLASAFSPNYTWLCIFRFIAEYFREPDDFLGLLALNLSMGQWLSLPMIAAGVALFAWAHRRGNAISALRAHTLSPRRKTRS